MTPRLTRRRSLRTGTSLALAAGFAGSTGGSSGGRNGGDGTPTGQKTECTAGSTPAGSVPCTALDDGDSHFDLGELPSVAEFDYAAVIGDLVSQTTTAMIAQGRRLVEAASDSELVFSYARLFDDKGQSTLVGSGDDDREVATTVDFSGQETHVVSNPHSPPTECPTLPGSYATHDTGATRLPVDFASPAAMEGSWSYQNRDHWASSNTVLGHVERGKDRDADGEVKRPEE